MSGDSFSTVSSWEFPTTPAELASREMDRLGYDWSRLDNNTKTGQETELEELNHPWKLQDVGPRDPIQPQQYFCRIKTRFREVLNSRWHIATMRNAIGLGERLLFTQASRRIAGVEKSVVTAEKMEELSKSHFWTYILQEGFGTGSTQKARVSQGRPYDIFLDFKVVDNAARAGYDYEMNPSERTEMIYKRHIFMLGVILGRILYKSFVEIIIDMGPRPSTVAAVIDWENKMLGGHLVGCGAGHEGSQPTLDSLVIQYRLVKEMDMHKHFIIRDEDLLTIYHGEEGWESLFPLKPFDDKWIRGKPEHQSFKIPEVKHDGIKLCYRQGYLTRVLPPVDD